MLYQAIRKAFSTVTQQATVDTEALLKKLQAKASTTLSRDNYQINVGLLIQRDPIFLKYSELEMQYKKRRYQLDRKYGLLPTVHKDLLDFQMVTSAGEKNSDDTPSHVRMIGEDRTMFRENSKHFKFVDPKTTDRHSIQFAGLYTTYLLLKRNGAWRFPSIPVQEKQTFKESKEELFKKICKNPWELYFSDRHPRCVLVEEFKDLKPNARVKGIKTFFFNANHIEGKVSISSEYEDFGWVAKPEMNQFLSQQDFEGLIHSLDL